MARPAGRCALEPCAGARRRYGRLALVLAALAGMAGAGACDRGGASDGERAPRADAGAATGDAAAAAGRPVVVVSVEPLAYVVERLADDRADIVVLIAPGASPATYEPTIEQVQAVSRAAIFVKVGHPSFPFERTWLDRLLADRDDLQVVDCSRGLDRRTGDPHVWTAPSTVRRFVPELAAALAGILPAERPAIEQRRDALLADLDRLDRDIRETLAGATRRRFYVYHPAWGYFADDFGLEQVPIEAGAKEPDPHQLGRLLEQARRDGTRVIFVQPQFSQRAARLVASELGARVVVVDPLARDWPDNLRRVAGAFAEALSDE